MSDDVRLTHIGGPTVLVEVAGWRILTDPTFDPPGRTYSFGWGTSSTKVEGPAIEPRDLPDVDLVLLSHDHHADNLDGLGRALLARVPVTLTTRGGQRRLGSDQVRGLAPWQTTVVSAPGRPSLTVTATPCRHGPPLSRPVSGDVIGFDLTWEGKSTRGSFWMTGDTVLHGALRDAATRLDVDVALIHLGAVGFPLTGPLRYSMSGQDAIELIELLRPRVAVPVHFEGWSHFSQQERDLHAVLDAAPRDVLSRISWLTRGTPTVA
ncbi:MBL fold metallo-hydrolase [Aeromicrobium choanae]|uniref:L-ascorbate metabolism protein UlaG, beta-lactamase superfamily n=1 Tax=Aeromicrobium choanae TaxID=1736691 RepID=A0A1T4Z785_9ACTN|nr:MBL fold metallo-hydrolase [Aeromicrobium choanae]SKB09872.1 L-ascorbate metabolism protein UlaG, beta-lactamase superfamily [Aeromicrobium choanae]